MGNVSRLYQNVVIILDDGSRHTFTGKACLSNEKETKRIINIEITTPRELPPGYEFEERVPFPEKVGDKCQDA